MPSKVFLKLIRVDRDYYDLASHLDVVLVRSWYSGEIYEYQSIHAFIEYSNLLIFLIWNLLKTIF